MIEFGRNLESNALKALHDLADEPGENWWKDLLRLWRPSGSRSEDRGLRLAVRRNYLNFYFQGQSVARVGFVAGKPYVSTHVKYVFGSAEGQLYAEMRDATGFLHPVTGEYRGYDGCATLFELIGRAGEYKGNEKTCVDELVAGNPNIVDLEMGLPGIALRMDCIALEREGDAIRIVFWEAKMIDDARLRSRSAPEVIAQLKRYQDFLDDESRALSVGTAYLNTCKLLNEIHGMAAQFSDPPALDPLVIAAATQPSVLKVDPAPRLVIFGGEEYQKKGNWDFHLNILKDAKTPFLVLSNKPYRLRRPDAGS